MGSRKDFEEKVLRLVESARQHLATDIGLTLDEATASQVFYAFSKAVRDRVMSNWVATRETMYEKAERIVYYVSAEYMIGRLLGNNLINMNMYPVARAALERLDVDINEVELAEPEPGLGNGGLGRLWATGCAITTAFSSSRFGTATNSSHPTAGLPTVIRGRFAGLTAFWTFISVAV